MSDLREYIVTEKLKTYAWPGSMFYRSLSATSTLFQRLRFSMVKLPAWGLKTVFTYYKIPYDWAATPPEPAASTHTTVNNHCVSSQPIYFGTTIFHTNTNTATDKLQKTVNCQWLLAADNYNGSHRAATLPSLAAFNRRIVNLQLLSSYHHHLSLARNRVFKTPMSPVKPLQVFGRLSVPRLQAGGYTTIPHSLLSIYRIPFQRDAENTGVIDSSRAHRVRYNPVPINKAVIRDQPATACKRPRITTGACKRPRITTGACKRPRITTGQNGQVFRQPSLNTASIWEHRQHSLAAIVPWTIERSVPMPGHRHLLHKAVSLESHLINERASKMVSATRRRRINRRLTDGENLLYLPHHLPHRQLMAERRIISRTRQLLADPRYRQEPWQQYRLVVKFAGDNGLLTHQTAAKFAPCAPSRRLKPLLAIEKNKPVPVNKHSARALYAQRQVTGSQSAQSAPATLRHPPQSLSAQQLIALLAQQSARRQQHQQQVLESIQQQQRETRQHHSRELQRLQRAVQELQHLLTNKPGGFAVPKIKPPSFYGSL